MNVSCFVDFFLFNEKKTIKIEMSEMYILTFSTENNNNKENVYEKRKKIIKIETCRL